MGRIFFLVAAGFGLVLASAEAHASPNPGGFWLSISANYRRGTLERGWGGFLALNVPFDALAAPRVPSAVPRVAEEPPKNQADVAPTNAESAPRPWPTLKPEEPPRIAPQSTSHPGPGRPSLTSRLARGAVRRALAVAGYVGTRARLGGLAARARGSAALPELRLRTLRSAGQTLRLTPTSDDPYRYTQAGTSELALEASLTWHLDRLIFADEEVSIERLQNERDSAERRLVDHVLQRLASWQRARARAADPDGDPEVRETAELEAIGAAVELDVLTDGWFSQAIGESEAPDASAAGEPPKVEVNTAPDAR